MSIGELLVKRLLDHFGEKYKNYENYKYYENFMNKYLTNYYDKYSQVKTFLHGGELMKFEDVYYPLTACKKSELHIRSAEELFMQDIPNFITITGAAGSGKSTFVKNLFIDVIKSQKAIPFLIEFRAISKEDNSMEDFIFTKLIPDKNTQEIVRKNFEDGKMIFFLDGYDELSSDDKVALLSVFIDCYPTNKFVVTSRPSAGANYLERLENFDLLALESKEVITFADQQLKFIDPEGKIKKGLHKSLEEGLENETIRSFLHNPLLLSIYILVYKHSPDIPKKKHLFYERILNALYYQHDSTSKPGYKREKRVNLDQDNIEKILKRFSYETYRKQSYTWNISTLDSEIKNAKEKCNLKFKNTDFVEDMLVSIALWTEDEGEYSFSHRSFQEYFTCRFIKEHAKKEDIYKGIVGNLFSSNRAMEIVNLLSILEEIDFESFIKHFKYPLFERTRNLLYDNFEDFIKNNIIAVYPIQFSEQESYEEDQETSLGHLELKTKAEWDLGMELGIGLREKLREELEKKKRMGMGMGMITGIAIVIGVMAVHANSKMERGIAKGLASEILKSPSKIDSKNTEKMSIFLGSIVIMAKDVNFLKYSKDVHFRAILVGLAGCYPTHAGEARSFMEKNQKKVILVEDIPKSVFVFWKNHYLKDYQNYKDSIDSELFSLEEMKKRFDENNTLDVTNF